MEFYYRFAIYGYSSDESLIVVRNTRHIQILRLISGLEQDDLTLPIVKLLTHPTYNEYQSQSAALSLYANVFIKFLPPAWGTGAIDQKEWKRRIKMYGMCLIYSFMMSRIGIHETD